MDINFWGYLNPDTSGGSGSSGPLLEPVEESEPRKIGLIEKVKAMIEKRKPAEGVDETRYKAGKAKLEMKKSDEVSVDSDESRIIQETAGFYEASTETGKKFKEILKEAHLDEQIVLETVHREKYGNSLEIDRWASAFFSYALPMGAALCGRKFGQAAMSSQDPMTALWGAVAAGASGLIVPTVTYFSDQKKRQKSLGAWQRNYQELQQAVEEDVFDPNISQNEAEDKAYSLVQVLAVLKMAYSEGRFEKNSPEILELMKQYNLIKSKLIILTSKIVDSESDWQTRIASASSDSERASLEIQRLQSIDDYVRYWVFKNVESRAAKGKLKELSETIKKSERIGLGAWLKANKNKILTQWLPGIALGLGTAAFSEPVSHGLGDLFGSDAPTGTVDEPNLDVDNTLVSEDLSSTDQAASESGPVSLPSSETITIPDTDLDDIKTRDLNQDGTPDVFQDSKMVEGNLQRFDQEMEMAENSKNAGLSESSAQPVENVPLSSESDAKPEIAQPVSINTAQDADPIAPVTEPTEPLGPPTPVTEPTEPLGPPTPVTEPTEHLSGDDLSDAEKSARELHNTNMTNYEEYKNNPTEFAENMGELSGDQRKEAVDAVGRVDRLMDAGVDLKGGFSQEELTDLTDAISDGDRTEVHKLLNSNGVDGTVKINDHQTLEGWLSTPEGKEIWSKLDDDDKLRGEILSFPQYTEDILENHGIDTANFDVPAETEIESGVSDDGSADDTSTQESVSASADPVATGEAAAMADTNNSTATGDAVANANSLDSTTSSEATSSIDSGNLTTADDASANSGSGSSLDAGVDNAAEDINQQPDPDQTLDPSEMPEDMRYSQDPNYRPEGSDGTDSGMSAAEVTALHKEAESAHQDLPWLYQDKNLEPVVALSALGLSTAGLTIKQLVDKKIGLKGADEALKKLGFIPEVILGNRELANLLRRTKVIYEKRKAEISDGSKPKLDDLAWLEGKDGSFYQIIEFPDDDNKNRYLLLEQGKDLSKLKDEDYVDMNTMEARFKKKEYKRLYFNEGKKEA